MNFEEYIRYLLSQQAYGPTDPYAPEPMYGSPVGGMLPAYDYGDLGDQAKALNITQDFSDIYSDPAVLGGFFGEMPGPSTYESFEPSPGNMMLQNALAKTGTLESLIAEEILRPDGSAATAMSLVNQMIADGTIPDGLVPQYTDEYDKLQYDTNYVKDLATQFQDAYLSDPMATGTDPTTGLPGVGKMADNPLAEWYQRTNTPTPDLRYTGNDLATEQQIMDLQTLPGQDAQGREAIARWVEQHDRASRNPAEFLAPPEGMAAPQGAQAPQAQGPSGLTPQRGGWADDLERMTQDPGATAGRVVDAFSASGLDRNIGNKIEGVGSAIGGLFDGIGFGVNNVGEGEEGGKIPIPWFRRQAETTGSIGDLGGGRSMVQGIRQPDASNNAAPRSQGTSMIDQMLGRREFGARQPEWNPNAAMQKSMQDEITANRDAGRIRAQWMEAEKQRKEREKIAQVLGAQGHTPYNDTMAQRRMMAQYMGFGA